MAELATSPSIVYNDPGLKSRYEGRKIPMNTFFEAYIEGKVDVTGDLEEFMRQRDAFVNYRITAEQIRFVLQDFIPSMVVHSKKSDHRFVTEHYDRGNDFFGWFLGESMVYTSAFFENKSETLEEAQLRKVRYVGEKLHLKKGERLLDIGCGWGTLVAESAAHFGVDATGVTISKNQSEFGTERIRARKVQDRARILTLDYRDIPAQRFDKISCLEMAEHVGVKNFQKFLCQVRDLLDDDGLFFLQIVGLRKQALSSLNFNEITSGLFMSKYIFPGADASLPLSSVSAHLAKAGFEIHSVENIVVHYGITIDKWYQNWTRNKDKVIAGYGDRWFRLWHLFLAWQTFTAMEGRAGCFQIVCNKARPAYDRLQWVGERLSLGEFAQPSVAQAAIQAS